MARRVRARGRAQVAAGVAKADEYYSWKARVFDMKLGVDAFCFDHATVEQRRTFPNHLATASAVMKRLDRQRFEDPKERAAAFEEGAVQVYGREAADAEVYRALVTRCSWPGPDDDFSRTGPFALPPDVVAECRARYRRHSGWTSREAPSY